MILYHGSTDLVDKPEIRESDIYLDFGVGFYTTTSFEQAERWAKIKMRRKNVDLGYVSIYEFDMAKAEKELIVKVISLMTQQMCTLALLQMIMYINRFVCLKQEPMMQNIL